MMQRYRTPRYKGYCCDTKVINDLPSELRCTELVQKNVTHLANTFKADIKIDTSDSGKRLLSYRMAHGKYSNFIDQAIGKRRENMIMHYRRTGKDADILAALNDYREQDDFFLNILPKLSDHPRALRARSRTGSWVNIGHVSSPYLGAFRGEGYDIEDIEGIILDGLRYTNEYTKYANFTDDYAVMVFNEQDNFYYPVDDPATMDCCSVIIYDTVKLRRFVYGVD